MPFTFEGIAEKTPAAARLRRSDLACRRRAAAPAMLSCRTMEGVAMGSTAARLETDGANRFHFSIETPDGVMLAGSDNGYLAYVMFRAALEEHAGRRILLMEGERLVAERC